MNLKLRPYRVINCHELRKLEQEFTQNLQIWNEEYALFSLFCVLDTRLKFSSSDTCSLFITEQKEPIALLATQDLSLITHCLFGEGSACFKAVSERVFIALLCQLLNTTTLQQQSNGDSHQILQKEWFYKGAPTCALILQGISNSMSITLYLHPQWILKKLPVDECTPKPLVNLHDALASQTLHCQVEFDLVTLQLKDMIHLKAGDIIKTRHRLATPLLLKANQQEICKVEIGETQHYKSIQITS